MKKGQSRSDRNRPVACFGARVRVGDAAASFERISTLGPKRVKFLQDLTLSLSKKSSKCCAFSHVYGTIESGDERCWNAGKWIEIW